MMMIAFKRVRPMKEQPRMHACTYVRMRVRVLVEKGAVRGRGGEGKRKRKRKEIVQITQLGHVRSIA